MPCAVSFVTTYAPLLNTLQLYEVFIEGDRGNLFVVLVLKAKSSSAQWLLLGVASGRVCGTIWCQDRTQTFYMQRMCSSLLNNIFPPKGKILKANECLEISDINNQILQTQLKVSREQFTGKKKNPVFLEVVWEVKGFSWGLG